MTKAFTPLMEQSFEDCVRQFKPTRPVQHNTNKTGNGDTTRLKSKIPDTTGRFLPSLGFLLLLSRTGIFEGVYVCFTGQNCILQLGVAEVRYNHRAGTSLLYFCLGHLNSRSASHNTGRINNGLGKFSPYYPLANLTKSIGTLFSDAVAGT